MNTWKETKPIGDAAERAIAAYFRRRGYTVKRTIGRDKRYDLRLAITLEGKYDRLALETGCVAVELSYRGRPSGIRATKATMWAFALSDGIAVLAPTKALRRLAGKPEIRRVTAGDDGAAIVALVPLADIRALLGAQIIVLA